ncbi:bifunctional metallophosphatase/5'-nucleotidase [Celeribacter sp.]|uniref:bifunctional metallophosphatase/5'-nucleotidase n=1 Tax=Celeribacter sp. TaxID=1890673 RepID=UPI003A94AD74
MLKNILATSVALSALAGAASADYTLHVIHINDLHSRLEPISKYDSTCSEEDNVAGECFGGVARVITMINQLRDELDGENVIVLDAGDQYQGSLMYTTYKGDAEIEFMNKIGFDAMAVGNHEFDDGDEGLLKLLDNAEFPVLSGNLDVSQSNLLAGKLKDTVVLDVNGEKVGIVSALAVDTPETSSPSDAVIFSDEIENLQHDVDALTAEGVNKIIALNHVGANKDMAIAGAVDGLDAVVGGHSHTLFSNEEGAPYAYPTMVDGVPVVQAYAFSKYVGHLTLVFDDEGNVTSATGDTILLDASVEEDAEVKARVAELAGPIEDMKSQIVAEAAADIDGTRESCRLQECQMGTLVSDAILDRTKDQGVEVVIQNGGGLRASIPAGQVSMGDIITVLPFQNTLATFEVTGETLLAALENGASQMEDVAGRFAQVAGMSYTVDPSAEVGSRISDVMVGGEPLEMDRVYLAATNNYVRNGGDGYSMFEDANNAYDYGPDLADVLAEYLIANAPYTPYTDGRITVK